MSTIAIFRILLVVFVLMTAVDAASAQALVFDIDGDGRVDRLEFVKGREARFRALDKNGDGVVSAADFPSESRYKPLTELMGRMIGQADLNHDEVVNLAELQLSGSPVFEAVDTNMNGLLDSVELARLSARLDAATKSP